MTKFLSGLLFFISAFLLVSCGSNNDDDSVAAGGTGPGQEEEVLARNFSTRINPNLLVEGTRCQGGETTTYNGTTYTCESGEWLMVLDNINTCSIDGQCTQIEVPSIVADLDDTEIISAPEFRFAEIDPESPVSEKQREVINRVYIRYDMNGDTEAVER